MIFDLIGGTLLYTPFSTRGVLQNSGECSETKCTAFFFCSIGELNFTSKKSHSCDLTKPFGLNQFSLTLLLSLLGFGLASLTLKVVGKLTAWPKIKAC
jgi:hypothetical protein